jgi:peptidoglycan hydrolase CwlO-like protein
MKTREADIGKMETQLKEWGAKLDELSAKADKAGTEADASYRKRIDNLKAKYEVAHSKLDELRAAGSEKWNTFGTGVESAWNELRDAFKELTN